MCPSWLYPYLINVIITCEIRCFPDQVGEIKTNKIQLCFIITINEICRLIRNCGTTSDTVLESCIAYKPVFCAVVRSYNTLVIALDLLYLQSQVYWHLSVFIPYTIT